MGYPKAYEPVQDQMFQILAYDNYNHEFDHLDYAKDKKEKEYLLENYRSMHGLGRIKVILLPKKYHPKN